MADRVFAVFGRRRDTAKQFVKFSVVGGINTAVDFVVYVALTRGTDFFSRHLLSAAAIAFSTALVCSFVLNTFWTFRAGQGRWLQRAPTFFAVGIVGIGINMAVLYLLISGGMYDLFAKAVAVLVSLVWNFAAHRRVTYRR